MFYNLNLMVSPLCFGFYLLRQVDKTQESKRILILSWPLPMKISVTKAGSRKMILQVRAEYLEMLCPLTSSSHTCYHGSSRGNLAESGRQHLSPQLKLHMLCYLSVRPLRNNAAVFCKICVINRGLHYLGEEITTKL